MDILSRDNKTYPETVEAAREAAGRLKEALEYKILGRELPEFSYLGSDVYFRKSIAVGIFPPEESDLHLIALPELWTVLMRGSDDPDYGYSTGLSRFLSEEEIEVFFLQYFRGVDTGYLEQEKDGQELRTNGKRIDITENNKALIEQGLAIMGSYFAHYAHYAHDEPLPEVLEQLTAKADKDELYLALIAAIHNAASGDVISVPADKMRIFAHIYIAFANVGPTYLLVECRDTVSIRGVIQNVRKDVQADLASPESVPK